MNATARVTPWEVGEREDHFVGGGNAELTGQMFPAVTFPSMGAQSRFLLNFGKKGPRMPSAGFPVTRSRSSSIELSLTKE